MLRIRRGIGSGVGLEVVALIVAAGAAAGIDTMDMASGAAHDTMYVADVTDAALLFAPSEGGISHSPREWTDWEDCADATRVLAGAIRRLAAD